MKKLFYVAFLLFGMSACSDDETVDIRIQGNGDYTYSSVISLLSDLNQTANESGTIQVESVGTNGLKFTFDKGASDELILNATGVTQASNGYVFNIQSTTEQDLDGDTFTISGTNTVTIDGLDYQGGFDSGSKQLSFTLVTDYQNNDYDNDFNVSIKIIATKK